MNGSGTEFTTFQKIREEGEPYMDKTLLIRDILDMDDRGAYLYARPHGFGKTVNITMLDAFFNLEYAGNTWFDGLEISEHGEFDGYRNAYPVILMNLGDLISRGSGFECFRDGLSRAMSGVFSGFGYLLDSDRVSSSDRTEFSRALDMRCDEADLAVCIRTLCRMLEMHHGVKPIVLVDDFDDAVARTADDPTLQGRIEGFMGAFMSATLKSNDCLQMGYITGTTCPPRIIWDVDNLTVNRVSSKIPNERFGFTGNEVRAILDRCGHPGKLAEITGSCCGYVFGTAEVYSPRDVMDRVHRGFDRYPDAARSGTSGVSACRQECLPKG